MKPIVGVLALQGGFAKHGAVLESIGARAVEVRTVTDLGRCDALVIPGGESTVLTKHLMRPDSGPAFGTPWEPLPLWRAIRDFADPARGAGKPVLGTCAGLIMLSRDCGDVRVRPFDLLPLSVERNAFGRQTESFIAPVTLTLEGEDAPSEPYRAVFIRAPRIRAPGEGVNVLATLGGPNRETEPVMVRRGNVIGLTFHPELTPEDTRIHRYFLGLIRN